MSGRIWLARHGETDSNAEGRVQGSIDPPLNDRGREQASELAEAAARIEPKALYTSQLRRARETAEIVAAKLHLEPKVDARFAESHRGEWEGRLIEEIRSEDPQAFADSLAVADTFRFPGGESLEEHARRVEAALADVRDGPLPALVICHGGTIRRVLAKQRPHEVKPQATPNGVLVQVD